MMSSRPLIQQAKKSLSDSASDLPPHSPRSASDRRAPRSPCSAARPGRAHRGRRAGARRPRLRRQDAKHRRLLHLAPRAGQRAPLPLPPNTQPQGLHVQARGFRRHCGGRCVVISACRLAACRASVEADPPLDHLPRRCRQGALHVPHAARWPCTLRRAARLGRGGGCGACRSHGHERLMRARRTHKILSPSVGPLRAAHVVDAMCRHPHESAGPKTCAPCAYVKTLTAI